MADETTDVSGLLDAPFPSPSPWRNEGLACAFADLIWMVYRRMDNKEEQGQPPPPGLTFEEVSMTLEERRTGWPDKWVPEAEHWGERRSTEQDIAQGTAKGTEQDIERSIEQGIMRGRREVLRLVAAVRFGVPTAEYLFILMCRKDDPQWLDEIGTAVLRCETADELLRQARFKAPVWSRRFAAKKRDTAMNEIVASMELENAEDRGVVNQGLRDEYTVRRATVNGVADPGAVMLTLPENVVGRLGLRTQRKVLVTDADERKETRSVAGPVTVKIANRFMTTECIVGPPMSEPRIGLVVFGVLDLVADRTNRTLAPRPESPDLPLLDVSVSPG